MNKPPPEGYRLLEVGERTRPGDIGFMEWGRKREWVELKAGHVLGVLVFRKGNVARKEVPSE